jgi:hypothetical protein
MDGPAGPRDARALSRPALFEKKRLRALFF